METTCINLNAAMKAQVRKRQASKPLFFESQFCDFNSSALYQELVSKTSRCRIEAPRRQVSLHGFISPPDSPCVSFMGSVTESLVPSLCGLNVPESEPQLQDSLSYRVGVTDEDLDSDSSDDSLSDFSDDDQSEGSDQDEKDAGFYGEETVEQPDLIEKSVNTLEEGYRLNEEIRHYEDVLEAKNFRIGELENCVRKLISVDEKAPRPEFLGTDNTVETYSRTLKKLESEKKILERKCQKIREEFDAYLTTAEKDQDDFYRIFEESNKQKDLMVDFYREECRKNKKIAEQYKSQLMKIKKGKPVVKKNGTISVRR